METSAVAGGGWSTLDPAAAPVEASAPGGWSTLDPAVAPGGSISRRRRMVDVGSCVVVVPEDRLLVAARPAGPLTHRSHVAGPGTRPPARRRRRTVRLRRRRRRTSRPAPPARPRSDIGFNYSPPGQYRRPRPPAGSVVACTECSVGHLRPRAPAPFRFPKTAVADI